MLTYCFVILFFLHVGMFLYNAHAFNTKNDNAYLYILPFNVFGMAISVAGLLC